MPLGKEHKARTRDRIVRSAGRVFRREGYQGAAIDAVMADAGLTRGGFYAHFASKDALFATVMATDHGLIRMLAARRAEDAPRWRACTLALLDDYLQPAHLAEVSAHCTFAALTAEARRGSAAVRSAYGSAFDTLVAELLRRHGEDARAARARANDAQFAAAAQVAVLMIGTLVICSALGPGPACDAALQAARALVRDRMREPVQRWR